MNTDLEELNKESFLIEHIDLSEGHEVISKELHDLLKKVNKDMNSQLNEINRLRKALEEIVRRNYTGASYLALTFLNDTPEEFKN
jgi:flagellar hook-associated protein FlgK